MKWLISYFYQVRNFKSNMIPLSTAISPPRWYKDGGLDKNGVFNGLEIPEFIFPQDLFTNALKPEEQCCRDCPWYEVIQRGKNNLTYWCPFMKIYYNTLYSQNLYEIIQKYENMVESINRRCHKNIDTIVLLVHEAPERRCSERLVLKTYFLKNGYDLEEFIP